MLIKVCGKYDLNMIPPSSQNGNEHSYYNYLKKAEKNSLCFEHLMIGLPTGMSVVEHFGGIGMTGVIIDNVIKPSSHLLFDIDENCLKCLKMNWGDNAKYGDAKVIMGTVCADLICLDFPNLNALHYKEWNVKNVFKCNPKYVTIADIARLRIGLHRESYSRLFGKTIHTNVDYTEALSNAIFSVSGYAIRKCAYHSYSFLLLSPGKPTPIEYWKAEVNKIIENQKTQGAFPW
jgi:hypothetical protein